MRTTVKVIHLEMRSPSDFRRSERVPRDTVLVRAGVPSPELGRFLYTAVGGDWFWRERLTWSWQKWSSWLSRPEVETWVAYHEGTPAGYFELEAQPEATTQITYFGLLPSFIGKGLGGYLLTQAVDRAWQMTPGVKRVWVHTCTLDHPGALPNYLGRGFRIFKEEEHQVLLTDQPPGPWPGANRPR